MQPDDSDASCPLPPALVAQPPVPVSTLFHPLLLLCRKSTPSRAPVLQGKRYLSAWTSLFHVTVPSQLCHHQVTARVTLTAYLQVASAQPGSSLHSRVSPSHALLLFKGELISGCPPWPTQNDKVREEGAHKD